MRASSYTFASLVMQVESSPEMEEGAIDVEHLLPFPHLLKGWKRETRERPNGTRDKVRKFSSWIQN